MDSATKSGLVETLKVLEGFGRDAVLFCEKLQASGRGSGIGTEPGGCCCSFAKHVYAPKEHFLSSNPEAFSEDRQEFKNSKYLISSHKY